jgi:hypothetical protein
MDGAWSQFGVADTTLGWVDTRGMPDYDHLWERLLEFLNTWATAAKIGPGRIRVAYEKSPGWESVVHILMTDRQRDVVAVR